jgi:hypothetical protein
MEDLIHKAFGTKLKRLLPQYLRKINPIINAAVVLQKIKIRTGNDQLFPRN